MEAYLQKNAPSKKTGKCTQKSRKNPMIKEEIAGKEKKTTDFKDGNIQSTSILPKAQCSAKINCFSTPAFLEAISDEYLIDDTRAPVKVEYPILCREMKSLRLKSECTKKTDKKKSKSKVIKKVPQESCEVSSDDEEEPRYNIDLMKYDDTRVFGNDTNSNQSNTTAEIKTDCQEIPLPQKLIDSNVNKPPKKSYKLGKNPKVSNPQKLYKINVPQPRNQVENLCTKCGFVSLNEPRKKKPLAVIDLGVTVYYFAPEQDDYRNPTPRPSLNMFFESLYEHYDLAFWANTSMDVLLEKMDSLEISNKHYVYKICFCLDNSSIINSYIPRLGNPNVQPLEVIWGLYPQYNEKNTILISDHRQLFYFNNKFAIQVKNFPPVGFIHDPNLISLTTYLKYLAKSNQDLSKVGIRITNAYMPKQPGIIV